MADDILSIAFGKPPKDAVAYLESKGFRAAHWNWWDTWQEAQARAFTVARTARMDVQQAIRDRMTEALRDGMTEREFIDRLSPELRTLGWWGRKVIVGADGAAEVVNEGSPWRLKTIYRTNMQSAYMAQRYKQQVENADSRPYWMYVAVMDAKTRASHAAMNGRVFRYDDPIWQTHYPPCAFNCRCRVRALTAQQVARKGIQVESSAGHLTQVMQDVGVDKRTGEVIQRPGTRFTATDGKSMTPAPGWNYNVGRAAFMPELDRYDYDIARQFVEGTLTGPAFARRWAQWDARVAEVRAAHPGIDNEAIREMFKREADPRQYWPVAILSAADRQLLGVQTQVARLSDWTLAKQAVSRGGQNFGVADFWRVQPTIEAASTVVLDHKPTGAVVYLFYGTAPDLYVAVLKPVRNPAAGADEVYLDSFRRSNERELRRARQRYDVVRG